MKLTVSNLSTTIAKKNILKDINFSLGHGVYSIIGPNGAGKTTLLKSLAGILPSSGEIFYGDENLKQNSLKNNAKLIAFMHQFQEVSNLNVYDLLSLGRRPHGGYKLSQNDKNIIDETVHTLNLKKFLNMNTRHLSGGERQKIFLAKALIQKPKILLLDEPISHLDPKNQIEILNIVKEVTIKQKLITITVLHDLHNALHFSDALLMLKNAKLLYRVKKEDVDETMLNHLFDIECKIFQNQGHPFVMLHHKHSHNPHTYHKH